MIKDSTKIICVLYYVILYFDFFNLRNSYRSFFSCIADLKAFDIILFYFILFPLVSITLITPQRYPNSYKT